MFNILICDDETEILEGLSFLFRRLNIEITTCESGRAAISLIESQSFDIIVCDYMMPDLTGEDVLNFLNMNPKNFPGLFIFFSAHFNLLGFSQEDVIVIPKPEINTLIVEIKKFLENYQGRNR